VKWARLFRRNQARIGDRTGAKVCYSSDLPRDPTTSGSGLDHIEVLAPGCPEYRRGSPAWTSTASVIKKWLAEFTKQRCHDFGIPTRRYRLNGWDPDRADWRPFERATAYITPVDASPVLLAPLDLLRRLPWTQLYDYYKSTILRLVLPANRSSHVVAKKSVLAYNRANYDLVRRYVDHREKQSTAVIQIPYLPPLQLDTLKRKATQIRAIPPRSHRWRGQEVRSSGVRPARFRYLTPRWT